MKHISLLLAIVLAALFAFPSAVAEAPADRRSLPEVVVEYCNIQHEHAYMPVDRYAIGWAVTAEGHVSYNMRQYACALGDGAGAWRCLKVSAPFALHDWRPDGEGGQCCAVCGYTGTALEACQPSDIWFFAEDGLELPDGTLHIFVEE